MLDTKKHDTIVTEQESEFLTHWRRLQHSKSFLIHSLLDCNRQGHKFIIGEPTDPVWVGYCAYLSEFLDVAIRRGKVDEKFRPVVAQIAKGGIIQGFHYCAVLSAEMGWETLFNRQAKAAIKRSVSKHGGPQPSTQSPRLELIDERLGLKPAPVLTLVGPRQPNQCGPLITLYDGRFESLLRPPSGATNLAQYLRTRLGRRRVWDRWLADSTLGLPPRDISIGTGRRPAKDLLPRILKDEFVLTLDDVHLAMMAFLENVWPEWVFTCIVKHLKEHHLNMRDVMREFQTWLPSQEWNLLQSHVPPAITAELL